MRKNLVSVGLLALCFVMVASIAGATPACVVGQNLILGPNPGLSNPPSPVDTNEPCTIGTLTFQNFSYASVVSGNPQGTPPDISVAGVSVGPPVLLSIFPNEAANGDEQLEFQVIGGVFGVDLEGTFSSVGGLINETICSTFTATGFCSAPDLIAQLTLAAGNVVTATCGTIDSCVVNSTSGVASVAFSGQSEIWAFKDISAGSTPFSEFTESFAIPEPMTLSLLGAGLLGLGLLRKRMQK